MAVQPNTGRTVPLYVLIIFVVLFVLSIVGLVVLFLSQEELRQNADRANARYDKLIDSSTASKLEAYAGKSGKKPAAALLDERNGMAKLLTGSESGTLDGARKAIQTVVSQLPPEAAVVGKQAENDIVGAFLQAITVAKGAVAQMETLKAELDKSRTSGAVVTGQYKELEEKFNQSAAQLTEQIQTLEKQFNDIKTMHEEQLKGVQDKVGADLKKQMDQVDKKFTQGLADMRMMVRRNLQSLIASMKELGPADQRTRSTITVDQLLQKSDGEILSVAGNVIYVSVGKQQGVQAGMRFCVFSTLQLGSARPQPKAVVELSAVGEMTSEARVVLSQPNDPVIKGDRISNIVFERELKFTYFVAGEFDLDSNDYVDPNGTQRVIEAIKLSGGKVVDQLSPAVDFVILGSDPVVPQEPAFGASEAVQAEFKKQQELHRKYADVRDQIQALAIPIIDTPLFVVYTGQALPETKEKK